MGHVMPDSCFDSRYKELHSKNAHHVYLMKTIVRTISVVLRYG